MTSVEDILAAIRKRGEVRCPHCRHEFNMSEGELYIGRTSYHGEEEPVPTDCPKCEAEVYFKEHVTRTWTVGRTPTEAEEL
ncbi:hypothetical protein [Methylobacterium thuringiense]|uniref:Small CPxCG-related zinc finger protein n=1 Tax=Methylobacterium thuringiense TaxID=1003091 RepID=A0ABQ4TKF1_9HYPH|nr:hypothetical protein [Methylobacterium thuringiense]GJE54532.1 hypothetical protein EKPJFOCH_1010 [Methylobacterium thuringiense]